MQRDKRIPSEKPKNQKTNKKKNKASLLCIATFALEHGTHLASSLRNRHTPISAASLRPIFSLFTTPFFFFFFSAFVLWLWIRLASPSCRRCTRSSYSACARNDGSFLVVVVVVVVVVLDIVSRLRWSLTNLGVNGCALVYFTWIAFG
jgi:hypothetical protein